MNRPLAIFLVCALFCSTLVGDVASQPRAQKAASATSRGLDLFVLAPKEGVTGQNIEVDVMALAFPTVRQTTPAANAEIEAAWDPEHLGKSASAPKSVTERTNASGTAKLTIPVPKGEPRALVLTVAVRAEGKERTIEVPVARVTRERIEVVVSETTVVPGGAISAWVLMREAGSDKPLAEVPVDVSLLEGSVARFEHRVVTDKAGSAMVRVPIPRSERADIRWMLRAQASGKDSSIGTVAEETLTPRDEIPGQPSFRALPGENIVAPGAQTQVRFRLVDASMEPVFGHAIRVWSGPRGTTAPSDESEFIAASTLLFTDGAGEIVHEAKAPTVVSPKGTSLQWVARTELDGEALDAGASIEVGRQRGTIDVLPEGGSLVPGLSHRVFFQANREGGAPLVGSFTVTGDGVKTKIVTDKYGEAEFVWVAPRDVGAARQVGPCAGGVAAAVRVRAEGDVKGADRAFSGELVGPDGLPVCVNVARSDALDIRASKQVVRAGDSIDVEIVGALPRDATSTGGIAFIGKAHADPTSVLGWLEPNTRRTTIRIPDTVSGPFDVSIAIPRKSDPAATAVARILVLPKRVPAVDIKPVTGRLVPGGTARVEAVLRDDAGKPVVGAVAAIMIDKLGGGNLSSLRAFDTRGALCASLGADQDRCEAFLFGDASVDAFRRGVFSRGGPSLASPFRDPAATMRKDLDDTFRTIVHSLEGAVWEASQSPETVGDVRRKVGGRYSFNPELMTLVTQAMSEPPLMPGGESVILEDLIGVDGQITFDNVSRRLVRLKLFETLAAARSHRLLNSIEPGEPILNEPNVLLRKLVRDGELNPSTLVDPWGGTLAFQKTNAPPVPFLTVTPGFELASAGPDGRFGTGDDVKSPFQRVLKSKTPYADAVDEDRLVDARWDMRVSDATVSAWETMIRDMTGTIMGKAFGAGGLGLSGIGEGGGGRGQGIGLGSVGTIGHGSGRGRWTSAIPDGVAFFAAPTRTDANGRVQFEVPLGSVETTWQLALVGIPDDGRLAVTTTDIASNLDVSAKVSLGAKLTIGDQVSALVTLRNRTADDLEATLETSTQGALALPKGAQTVRTAKIKRFGSAKVEVPILASARGKGSLTIVTRAGGVEDRVTHVIEVMPAGERIDTVRTLFVNGTEDLSAFLSRAPLLPEGPAVLAFELGEVETMKAAIASLDPDAMSQLPALRDAAAIGEMVRSFALGDPAHKPLLARAERVLRFAEGKLSASATGKRALVECPEVDGEKTPLWVGALELDTEPAPKSGVSLPCWTGFVAQMTTRLTREKDEASIARAVLALDGKEHRRLEQKTLRDRLVGLVEPTGSGRISLSESGDRSKRALVYAALLVTARTGEEIDRYLPWLLVQRDKAGSFGTTVATRGAILALTRLKAKRTTPAEATVMITVDGATQELRVNSKARATFALPPNASRVSVTTKGTGVLTRVERTYLRPFSVAPDDTGAPLSLRVEWPEAKRGEVQSLKVDVAPEGATWGGAHVALALPPGVTLAAPVGGVRTLRGTLQIDLPALTQAFTLFIPLRFGLQGSFTAPEPIAELIEVEAPRAHDRARTLVIGPPGK